MNAFIFVIDWMIRIGWIAMLLAAKVLGWVVLVGTAIVAAAHFLDTPVSNWVYGTEEEAGDE